MKRLQKIKKYSEWNKGAKAIQCSKDSLFKGVENTEHPLATSESTNRSYTLHKKQFKMYQRPKCKSKTINFLEDDKEVNLHDCDISSFLYMTSKAWVIRKIEIGLYQN